MFSIEELVEDIQNGYGWVEENLLWQYLDTLHLDPEKGMAYFEKEYPRIQVEGMWIYVLNTELTVREIVDSL